MLLMVVKKGKRAEFFSLLFVFFFIDIPIYYGVRI